MADLWTAEDVGRLKALVEIGKFDPEIAAELGRPIESVSHKRRRLGLKGNTARSNPVPSATPADPTDARVLQLEREVVRLRDELQAREAKLKATHREAALFEALAEVIRGTTEPLMPIRYAPPKARERATPVDGVVLLSDEHADEVIQSAGTWGLERYDFDVFRCRLHRWAQTVAKYATSYLPAHHFERLWVLKLGDSVQGDIHGAGPRNHFGNTLKAALACGDAEAQAIQSLIPCFPGGVHVVSVSGNHPRRSAKKDYGGPHDNFDFLVTTQMATRLEAERAAGRVTIHAPESWTAFVDVRGHLFALNHGDDVSSWAGFPWYGYSRKNQRVQALVARMGQRVHYFAYGHFHTAVSFPEAGARSLHNGAWAMTDQYALERLGGGNDPVQPMYAVQDSRGIILEVPIYLRDTDAEERFRAGEWEPPFGRSLVAREIEGASEAGLPVVKAA